jgi:hypothetical protein
VRLRAEYQPAQASVVAVNCPWVQAKAGAVKVVRCGRLLSRLFGGYFFFP